MIVLLCRDLETQSFGMDLDRISESLRERYADIEVRVVEGPCDHHEEWLSADLRKMAPVVLAVCSSTLPVHERRAHARKRGFDPCMVETVDLGGICERAESRERATEQAEILLRGAVGRCLAETRSIPENFKMIVAWEGRMSRRSLLTLPPVRYEVVPFVVDEACVADRGCRICEDLCPHDALTLTSPERMELLKDKCSACGACVSVCPRDAIHFPAASSLQIGAQVEALLDGNSLSSPRGIIFACHNSVGRFHELSRSGNSILDGWFPVEVPCTGMITPTWILKSLQLGAAAVGLLVCPENDCRYGGREEMAGRVDYCSTLLNRMGMPSGAVQLVSSDEPDELQEFLAVLESLENRRTDQSPLLPADFSPLGAAGAVRGLAEFKAFPVDLVVAHAHSPLGNLEVEKGCTLCGACVAACPSDALSMEAGKGEVLSFSPAACVACGACVPVCPENVMRTEKVTRLASLMEEEVILFQDTSPRCVTCGKLIMPHAMLNRLKQSLKDHPSFDIISQYCIDCRKTMF